MTMTAPLVAPAPRPARVEELQARIRGMQATRLDSKAVPTHPALESVLPGGTLREGTVVQVEGSTTLLMALLAGPTDHVKAPGFARSVSSDLFRQWAAKGLVAISTSERR